MMLGLKHNELTDNALSRQIDVYDVASLNRSGVHQSLHHNHWCAVLSPCEQGLSQLTCGRYALYARDLLAQRLDNFLFTTCRRLTDFLAITNTNEHNFVASDHIANNHDFVW